MLRVEWRGRAGDEWQDVTADLLEIKVSMGGSYSTPLGLPADPTVLTQFRRDLTLILRCRQVEEMSRFRVGDGCRVLWDTYPPYWFSIDHIQHGVNWGGYVPFRVELTASGVVGD